MLHEAVDVVVIEVAEAEEEERDSSPSPRDSGGKALGGQVGHQGGSAGGVAGALGLGRGVGLGGASGLGRGRGVVRGARAGSGFNSGAGTAGVSKRGSKVWGYYEAVNDDQGARVAGKCLTCRKTFSARSGTTSGMRGHLQRCHTDIYANIVREEITETQKMTDSEIKAKMSQKSIAAYINATGATSSTPWGREDPRSKASDQAVSFSLLVGWSGWVGVKAVLYRGLLLAQR